MDHGSELIGYQTHLLLPGVIKGLFYRTSLTAAIQFTDPACMSDSPVRNEFSATTSCQGQIRLAALSISLRFAVPSARMSDCVTTSGAAWQHRRTACTPQLFPASKNDWRWISSRKFASTTSLVV